MPSLRIRILGGSLSHITNGHHAYKENLHANKHQNNQKKKKKVTQGNRDNPEYKEKDLYLEIQEDETSIKQEQDAI